jgi:hypothetical protein
MTQRRTLLAGLLLSPLAARAQAQTPPRETGSLRVETPWTRAALQGRQGAGFLTIHNSGTTPDRLLAATSPVSGRVELHTHIRDGEVMRMRPVENIVVPPNGSVSLEPGGLHLMLTGLNQALVQGGSISVTLRFEHAGEITIELAVQSAGARGPAGAQGHRH